MRMFFAFALGVLTSAVPAAAATVKVITYNTHHGGQTTGTTDSQIAMLAAQKPDVIVLQEASATQLSQYVSGLNARLGTSAWHGKYTMHCKAGTKPTCRYFSGESVMILTRLRTISSSAILIWAPEDYWVARGVLHMEIAAGDGTTFHVFACHLPALADASSARITWVNTFVPWAANYGGARLVGGDFNAHPGTTPINMMENHYADNWKVAGSGYGYTHNATSPATRLDYWFTSRATVSSISVIPDKYDSDHRPVMATFSISGGATTTTSTATASTAETTLMSDGFGSLDRSKWPNGVFTGTQDANIAMGATSLGIQIGPLKSETGSHFNGFSSSVYDLSKNGAAAVQLIKAPNTATSAYAMFAVGSDSGDYYRWYESGNELVAEKRVSGIKTRLVNVPYSATAHQFLRIRNEYNASTGIREVVFETAPNSGGAAGAWTVRHREAWDRRVNIYALRFELKAGTSEAASTPGSSTWDNFRASLNSK